MARMNISIPDSLKDEMDELSSVNWSALAAEVFGREVRKSREVDAMNTEQVVERLRASYEEVEADFLNLLMVRETQKLKEELLTRLKKSADIKIFI